MQTLIDNDMHEVLINNDQLRHNMSKRLVLQNFQGTATTYLPNLPASYSIESCYLDAVYMLSVISSTAAYHHVVPLPRATATLPPHVQV